MIELVRAMFVVALTGCVFSPSLPTEFYTLSALDADSMPKEHSGVSLGVGPVEFPELLDRPQLVTRTNRNELKVAEFHHWAGSVRDDFSRVLAENLSLLLGTDQVLVYPWRSAPDLDYHVAVNVTRFDATLGGDAVLSARWTVFDGGGEKVLVTRKSRLREKTNGRTHSAAVVALNQALDGLSRDIASAVSHMTTQDVGLVPQ